jgi:GH24 family phage-related lysozyme (muramidase)
MRSVVIDQFIPFNIPKEGRVRHLYIDLLGWVTVGIGNLVDPASLALALPFVRVDGERASESEILAEWQRVKNQACGSYATPKSCTWVLPDGRFDPKRPCLAHQGHRAAANFTKLSLSEYEIGRLCSSKMSEMWTQLRHYIPNIDGWPCDAQMALLSLSWAMGPGFVPTYPKFFAAAKRNDFETCAAECGMRESDNPGVKPRNIANKILFMNAHWIVQHGFDLETLYYPRALAKRDAPQPNAITIAGSSEITIEMSPIPPLGDTLSSQESLGFYEADGGFARRQMLSEVITNLAFDEITKRNGGQ